MSADPLRAALLAKIGRPYVIENAVGVGLILAAMILVPR